MPLKIVSITDRAFHLPGDNIDTDRIIPARFLKCITFNGLEAHVFADDRTKLAGAHPFDNPVNQGRTILVVDSNFGSGSSREHAPQALKRWGIAAIVGRSFADIFSGNATAIGLPCVCVDETSHHDLLVAVNEFSLGELIVDLERNQLVYEWRGRQFQLPITLDPAQREMLINGTWDTIATLLEVNDQVDAVADRLPPLALTE
ncbi:MAG: hypothetical protein A3A24_00835 [Candidatus Buchananbacteria bacterium RIFCSPLOWO2_01_FULL_46_12]|uniref:3-isopropylmalate dehydratase n=1 Tax=Candidatus Buchananbacteria bacterium RIFCSPLOWO2_01_FULL_46_12 TaxID=1797546 RepID=A0A1G1YN40_9BACT|nr:MAG: hypothetical protein A3A24_00835 [Candidatus Buchananbacteria bacterium RIFCSPLOWO2_01_FULL_46_12]